MNTIFSGFVIIELKIYHYDRQKINNWRKKNKDKIVGKGHYPDGYHYICSIKLKEGEVIEFPDTALNVVGQKITGFCVTGINR